MELRQLQDKIPPPPPPKKVKKNEFIGCHQESDYTSH